VGTLLLLLPMLLLLLLYEFEANDSLTTKNFVKLWSNDVGTTAGQRAHSREHLDLNAVA